MSDSTPPVSVRPTPPMVRLAAIFAVVAALALAKAVLIPLALAFYLAFVLTPPLKMLERLGVPRGLSVTLTVALMLGVLGGMGAVLASQVDDLSSQVVKYSSSMRQKVGQLRQGRGGPLALLESTVNRLGDELDEKNVEVKAAAPVRIVGERITARERLEALTSALLQPLSFVAIVLVLVVFLLSRREDLRDRLIRLVGRGKVTLATRTMDEAVQRISRFLLALSLINLGFGIVVAGGLAWIGVPYALLWGFLAGLLRFVPYVGSLLAMVMPTLLAFAMFPGWTPTLLTLALFAGVDLLTGYFAEPVLVGHRTGVSSLALLVSSIFWAWLWGPIGLLLATPLTVCAAVLGRHVPQLHFLSVALGDAPALEMDIRLYQRLLAHDRGEAETLALRWMKEKGFLAAVDEVLVPALCHAARDRDLEEITDEDFSKVQADTLGILRRLERVNRRAVPPSPSNPTQVLGLPAFASADGLLLELLAPCLAGAEAQLEVLPPQTDLEAQVREVVRRRPQAVFIATLPPEGGAKARYLCRRLRAALPHASVTVLRPSLGSDDPARSSAALREAGAGGVAESIQELLGALERTVIRRPVTRLDRPAETAPARSVAP